MCTEEEGVGVYSRKKRLLVYSGRGERLGVCTVLGSGCTVLVEEGVGGCVLH